MTRSKLVRSFACASFLLTLGACDKLKSAVGLGDGDGGASASASGLSLSGLEGELDIAATSKTPGKPDKVVNIAMLVKGSKFRTDLPAGIEGAEKFGKVYGIVDTEAKKAYVVLDAQKEVIEIDLNKVGDEVKSMTPPSTPTGGGGTTAPPEYPPKITKTGKTDTVAGYTCEIWDIASTEPGDKSKADVCVAQQGVSWFHIPLTGAPAKFAALGELVDGSHFPLRGVATGKDGVTENGRVEVTKIDKKTLDPNLFVPPPTYKVIDVNEAIAGFMGGMGGPAGAGGFGGHVPPHGGLPSRH